MRKYLFAIAAALALAGCTETALITDACEADAIGQPIVVGAGVPLATLAGQGAPAALAATIDDPIHKDIQADCAKALAPAAAPVAPAPVVTPAPVPAPAVPVPTTPAVTPATAAATP